MKNLFTLLCILCIFSLSTYAQEFANQGKWTAGGTMPLGISSEDFPHLSGVNGADIWFGSNWTSNGQTSDKHKFISWAFTPQVGYFVIDYLAILLTAKPGNGGLASITRSRE